MHNMSDFYDKLDLKYPEIGIAVDNIDRSLSRQDIKFIIPVLTPNMNNTSMMSKVIHQNRSNLMNDSRHKLEIEDIILTNYTEIPVPREVLGYSEGDTILALSKWIIVFVGGDITKPRVIARYFD